MRIYVAGPYTAPTPELVQKNVDEAMAIGAALLTMGHNPLVPHWNHYMDLLLRRQGIDVKARHWLNLDFDWLNWCEGLYLLGHSPGADEELSRAMRLGLPVFTKLEDVPNLIRQVDPGLIVVPMQGVVAPAAAAKARPSLSASLRPK